MAEDPWGVAEEGSYPDPQQGGTWTVRPEERNDDIEFHPGQEAPKDPWGVAEEAPKDPWGVAEEPPSAVGTAVRGVLRGAIPMTAGVLGGAAGAAVGGAAGGAAGTAVPVIGNAIGAGVGGFGGALIGYGAASAGARGVQDKITDALGIDSPESRAADQAAHPYITEGAEFATGIGSMSTSGRLAARVAAGGLLGSFDLLNQGIQKGTADPRQLDWTEAGIAAGFGAAAPTPHKWVGGVDKAGQPFGLLGPVEAGAAKFFGQTPKAGAAPGQTNTPAGEITQQGLNVETPDVGVGQASTADQLNTQFPKTSGITEVKSLLETPDKLDAMAEHPPAAGSNVNETPPSVERTLTPEEIADRQAQLIATQGRPMVGKSGRPFAPQAKNLRVGEEPPPASDVTSGPGRFSDGDSVATAPDATAPPSAGTESSPTNPAPGTIRFYHGAYNDPTTGGPRWLTPHPEYARNYGAGERAVHYVDVPREEAARLGGYDEINNYPRNFEAPEEIAQKLKPVSENFGGRGVDGQNENTRNFGPLLSPTDEALIETSRAQRGAAQNAREKAAQGQEGEAFLPEASETPSNADIDAARAKLQKQTAHLEGKNSYTDPKTGKRWEKVGDQWFEILELQPKEPPKPQSLSAAAPEGGALGTYKQASAAEDLKWRGGYQGAVNAAKAALKKLTKYPREIYAPETLSKDSDAMDKIIRSTYGPMRGQDVADVQAMRDSMADLQGHIQKVPADARIEAIQNYERGTVQKSNPLYAWSEAAKRTAQRLDNDLSRIPGGEGEYGVALSSMFERVTEGRDNVKHFIDQFRQDNKRNPTLGEVMQEGFQLRDEFRDADNSPNIIPAVMHQNFLKSKVLEKNRVIEQGRNTQIGDHMILSEREFPGSERIDPQLTPHGVPLYADRGTKLVLERYFNPYTRDPAVKDVLDGAMYLKNATNAWNLAIDLYHMNFMMQEGMGAAVARGFGRITSNPQAALKDIMGAPLAPYTLAKSGQRNVLSALKYPEKVTDPFQKGVINNLQSAGILPGRQHGSAVTPELETGFMNNYINAFKPAWEQYKHDLVQRGLKAGSAAKKGELMGAASHAALGAVEAFSRGLQLVMHPFFNTYIPLLKAGVAYEGLASYKLDHPGLGDAHYTEIAKRYVKTVDNSLGELNQSTLYWPPMMKFLGNLATVSLGWNVGNWRQVGSAVGSLVRNPKSAFTSSKDFNPAISSLAAGLVVAGIWNILYQTAKTGKPPDSLTDVVAPRTGGLTRKGNPERAILPGYEKDWLEAAHIVGGPEPVGKGLLHMAYNKLAALPRAALDIANNENFAGKQIANPNDPFLTRMQEYLGYVGKHVLEPIGFQNVMHEEKNKKTNISTAEKGFGIRHAPEQWQDPNQYARRIREQSNKAAKDAKKFHQRTGY